MVQLSSSGTLQSSSNGSQQNCSSKAVSPSRTAYCFILLQRSGSGNLPLSSLLPHGDVRCCKEYCVETLNLTWARTHTRQRFVSSKCSLRVKLLPSYLMRSSSTPRTSSRSHNEGYINHPVLAAEAAAALPAPPAPTYVLNGRPQSATSAAAIDLTDEAELRICGRAPRRAVELKN
eukprot:1195501-Prorocentrum_minimum.AAC.1